MAEQSDREEDRLLIILSESESDSAPAAEASTTVPEPPLPKRRIICRLCGQQGHIRRDCRNKQKPAREAAPRNVRADARGNTERFAAQADNAGFQLWRANKSAYSTFDFPKGFQNAPDMFGEHNRPLRIGHFTNTYVVVSRVSRHGKFKAAIWAADPKHNDHARVMLAEWRDEVVPIGSRHSKSQLADGHSQHAEQAEKRRKFLREFTEDEKFAKFYRVSWQLEGDELSPQSVLGNQLQGLDGIRMDHEVYIKLIGKDFGVLGANEAEARKACIRLQNAQWNALARDCPTYQFYLVKAAPLSTLRRSVVHQRYAEPRYLDGSLSAAGLSDVVTMVFGPEHMDAAAWTTCNQTCAQTIHDNEMAAAGTNVNVAIINNRLNALYIDLWFSQMMRHQPYYVGHLRMRASIGTCLMTCRMKGDQFSLDTFCERFDEQNRDQRGIESIFTAELGDVVHEQDLLLRFMAQEAPVREDRMPAYMYHDDGSPNMAPHTTSIQFTIAEGGEAYELDVAFNNVESRTGDATWTKLGATDFPFDVNLFDLHKPYLSYNLHVDWRSVLDKEELWKLPSSWIRFFNLVEIKRDVIDDPQNHQQAFDFPGGSSGSLPVSSFTQKQVWRFHENESSYVIELQRLQKFDCKLDNFGVIQATAYEPRYGVQVYHPLWDKVLAENALLKLGYRAHWTPSEHEFFPLPGEEVAVPGSVWERGSGVREWLRVMKVVEKIIFGEYESKEELQKRMAELQLRARAEATDADDLIEI